MRKAIRAVQKAISTVETAKMTADEVVQVEMEAHLRKIAKRICDPGDFKKEIWGDLARFTGLDFGHVKRIWKKEWKIIPGSVVRLLDGKLAELERKADAEQETLQTRFYALNHHSSDPDFYQARTATGDQPTDELG